MRARHGKQPEARGIKQQHDRLQPFDVPIPQKCHAAGLKLKKIKSNLQEVKEMSGSANDRLSPLHDEHVSLGAALTSFAGWQMPLRYSSDIAEHTAVRTAAGLFDLSHMGEIGVTGPDAGRFLDYALVGNLSGLRVLGARYTMICAEDGGVVDDLIVYRDTEDTFLVVANASNHDTVLAATMPATMDEPEAFLARCRSWTRRTVVWVVPAHAGPRGLCFAGCLPLEWHGEDETPGVDIVLRGLSPSSMPRHVSFADWTFTGIVPDLDELATYLANRLGWSVADDRRARMRAHLALKAKREVAGFRLEISRKSAVLVWGKS